MKFIMWKRQLKINRLHLFGTGLDGIGSRILKAGAPVLSIYLSNIFNCSLATGYVPKCWKMKRVSPVHKGDVKTDPSNFSFAHTYENL